MFFSELPWHLLWAKLVQGRALVAFLEAFLVQGSWAKINSVSILPHFGRQFTPCAQRGSASDCPPPLPREICIHYFFPHPVFSSQSAGSVDLTEILLASHGAALQDFMALSYGPARALEYDRRRGFRALFDCDDRYGGNFCLERCNAHKRVQTLPAMPLHRVRTVDAPLQELGKSRKK